MRPGRLTPIWLTSLSGATWRGCRRPHPALVGGWGQPQTWLETAQASFAAHGIDALAARCAELLSGPRPGRWTGLGITAREADVLALVAEGLANKDIAARLHVSPRTVEKHVESLLRKAGARSRTQLVAVAGPAHPGGNGPASATG